MQYPLYQRQGWTFVRSSDRLLATAMRCSLSGKIACEVKMNPQPGKRQTVVSLLMTVFLFSLFLSACDLSSAQTKPQPQVQATTQPPMQATLPPLSTFTVASGWKIAFQITRDATKLRVGESQSLSLSQVPPSKSFLVLALCTGNGSVDAVLEGKGQNANGTATSTTEVTAACAPSNTSSPASSSTTGNIPEYATLYLTITGPVKWEVVIEEPV